MVVTRSGVCVQSPTKTESDQASGVQATPSTGWRTRRTAADPLAQRAPGETSSELHGNEGELAACCPTSTIKRCTRVTRPHSPAQPSTPVESTHEADVSDLESCCSVVSDMEPLVTRAKGRKRRPRTADQEEEVMSDAESCSSAVSASKTGLSVRRSTRKKRLPESSEQAPVEKEDVSVDQVLETKSCSVVVSDMELLVNRARGLKRRPRTADQEEEEMSDAESCSSAVSASKTGLSVRRSTRKKRLPESSEPAPVEKEDVNVDQVLETESCSVVSEKVTRNQKKAAGTRVRVESEASDADSCISSVSGASASKSIRRRATRSTRQTCPLPIYLDEASESSQSPALTGRRTRAARGKPAASVDAGEPQSCDSEGFESGPIYSVAKAQSAAPNATDSDLTGLHSLNGSPCSTPGRGTGSGNSRQGARASRHSVKNYSMVVEADDSLNESRLDSTLINEDADCTMLADEPGVSVIPEEGSHVGAVSPSETAETTEDQRVALSTEHKNGAASEVEMAQETIPSPELIKPCPSVIVAVCDTASDVTNEKDEVVDVTHVETHSSLGVTAVDDDAAGETQSSEVEKTEVSTQETDDQRVDASCEAQAESILVTSKQQHEITVNSDPDNEPTDITVQKAKVISLLDSSDDEDSRCDEEEDRDGSDEDDLEGREEERGGPSKKPESAGVSVDGLFMIDTRPGEDADEDYYKDRPTEQREQAAKQAEQEAHDEEFIDEEGDDEDDEDTEILFSSRDLQAKELSSRIDPGLKLKALGGLYINFDGSKSKPVSSSLLKLKEKKIQDEVMKKSVIGPDFEKKDAVPPYRESKQALKLKHREERAKSTGEGWFNMKAPELTHELKGDLQVLKMRGSMDPKRFYKKNDRDGFPKYFQIGTVVDSPVDFYHSRIPKKQRKRTMVEELLADAEFRHNNKKKFQHIVMENAAQAAGKKNKKKKFKKN